MCQPRLKSSLLHLLVQANSRLQGESPFIPLLPGLFEQALDQQSIEDIRYGVRKGLPTGSVKFKQQIEAALSIKLGDGKRGRPAKKNE